jgi:hypothetical protein
VLDYITKYILTYEEGRNRMLEKVAQQGASQFIIFTKYYIKIILKKQDLRVWMGFRIGTSGRLFD